MIEPISTATIAETAVAVAEVNASVAEATMIEAKEIAKESAKISIQKVKENILSENFLNDLKQKIAEKKYLTDMKDSMPVSPEGRLARLQELKANSNFKGELGECISACRDGLHGEVSEQVVVGDNRVDHVTELRNPVKYMELEVNNGEIKAKDLYINEGQKVVVEVKNGGFSHLESELKGRLPSQITAGLEIAPHSHVEINLDCYNEALANDVRSINIIKQIQECGGRVIVGLPSFNDQLETFIKVLG